MLYFKKKGTPKTSIEVGWFIFYKSFHFGCFLFTNITGGKSKRDVNNDDENMVSKQNKTEWQKKTDYTVPKNRVNLKPQIYRLIFVFSIVNNVSESMFLRGP